MSSDDEREYSPELAEAFRVIKEHTGETDIEKIVAAAIIATAQRFQEGIISLERDALYGMMRDYGAIVLGVYTGLEHVYTEDVDGMPTYRKTGMPFFPPKLPTAH